MLDPRFMPVSERPRITARSQAGTVIYLVAGNLNFSAINPYAKA
jgi:hypothetical protein